MSAELLAEALAGHVYPGEVMTALDEAWIECSCGERIPIHAADLKVRVADVAEAFHTHAADALLASSVLAQIVADAKAAERERVAQAIEAHLRRNSDHMTSNQRQGFYEAARIAREPS